MREFDKKKKLVHFMYTLKATNMDFGDNYYIKFFFLLLPNADRDLLIHEFSKLHTATHHIR